MNKLLNIALTNPKKTCSLFVFISLISLIVISNLKINTSTDSLINENLDFKKNQKQLKDSFKVLNNNILIRITGENYDEVKFASERFVKKLNDSDGVSFIFSPNLDKNLKKNFFLFLNDFEKDNLIQKIYESQPFLSQINNVFFILKIGILKFKGRSKSRGGSLLGPLHAGSAPPSNQQLLIRQQQTCFPCRGQAHSNQDACLSELYQTNTSRSCPARE